MMREIKFRGKATIPHEDMGWVYGSLVIGPVFNSIHFTTNKGPQSVFVNWSEIGQYTGLKDENGVEIYEGDVLEIQTKDFSYDAVVVYVSDLASFCVSDTPKEYVLFSDIICSIEDGGSIGGWIKVIGNVFDNPELKEKFWKHWEQE